MSENLSAEPPTNSIYLGSSRRQHQYLVSQSAVVMKLGLLMLKSGASAFRVKTSMARLARAVGLEEHHSQVTFTELTTTAYAAGNFRTEIGEQRAMGISAYRIDLLSDFVSNLPEKISPFEAGQEIDRIARLPHLYPQWLLSLAAAFACAGFAFLNNGGVVECSIVFFCSGLGQLLRSFLLSKEVNHLAIWFLCGVFSAGTYICAVSALTALGLTSSDHLVGFISAILFLVPGFPLVTAMLDLARFDFSAAIGRLTYVGLLLASASFAVWILAFTFELPLQKAVPLEFSPMTLYSLRVAASFIAAYGFAMLFSAMPTSCLWAGIIAAVVNPLRILATDVGLAPQLAVFTGALLAATLAEIIAPLYRRKYSRVSLSVPAVVTMVPGVTFYRSMAHLSDGDIAEAAVGMVEVWLLFFAIGMGLVFARFLMDKNWFYNRDLQKVRHFNIDYHLR
ncbi:threonine/serine ThrE exporter family protein [Rothia sp. CCM 9419]|uniref:threonine/serine ThrE exporter family protein n=1 Tax=Rothia sp. CCM 9419 TaxID=3402662 RepID=UPI003AE909ED